MRRTLALVCIFILLLFTGMPMFTSNLLCNGTRVYADETPNISDNEKIRAAITVYLNSKGAYLSSQGLQMDAVMTAMQSLIDDFLIGGPIVAGEVYTQTKLLAEIGVNTSPLTVILRAGAVAFFNAFLQWLIDEGKITTGQNSDGLYDGFTDGSSLYFVLNQPNLTTPQLPVVAQKEYVIEGTSVNGISSQYIKTQYENENNGKDLKWSDNTDLSVKSYTLNVPFNATYTGVFQMRRFVTSGSYSPMLATPVGYSNNDGTDIFYSERVYKIYGMPCYLVVKTSDINKFYYAVVSHNVTNDTYGFSVKKEITNNSEYKQPANINFNKDNFDPTPTTPPSGSDGLTYQPRQTGTGNTYNTYNDYYQDWHEGDTYIYNPGSGGGGSGGDDPGQGEDPTPGGTTPPWDGTQNPGTPSGTLTPGSDGYYFNLPDIGLPDLDIDWSINGLKEKFPFSIPWDLMAFFAVMNAEPETPYIQADIPLGLWEWNIDWDLHAFDNVARILRNMELIGFCIGLILITRSIIKG